VLSLESTTVNKTLIFKIQVQILSQDSVLNKTMYVSLHNVIIKNDVEINIIDTPCIKVGSTHRFHDRKKKFLADMY